MQYTYNTEMTAICSKVKSITRADNIASVFVLLVVGFCLGADYEELTLCEVARSQLTYENEIGSRKPLIAFCNVVLAVVSSIRQHAVIPLVITQIPDLIAYRGSAALDQAMNGLALLFILELDNMAYSVLGDAKATVAINVARTNTLVCVRLTSMKLWVTWNSLQTSAILSIA